MQKIRLVVLVGLCAIIAFGCVGSAQSDKSVSLSGHTFTAALDDSWDTTLGEVTAYKPEDMDDGKGIPSGATDWTGTEDFSAFYYRSGEPSGSITKYGWAEIFVIKPKKDLAGSSSTDILKHATDIVINPRDHRNAVLGGDLTEKEIDYNGKKARLVEVEGELMRNEATGEDFINHQSYGAIAFFLDDGTVALIDVMTTNNYGMRAWDVIKSITVTASGTITANDTILQTSKAFGMQGNLVDRNFDGLQDVLKLSPESTVMAYWINLIPSRRI